MTARRLRPVLSPRCYHLWPHHVRVLDLGDDAHAAVHIRDFATHDYSLRGVRWRESGSIHVIAYYDGQHQSALTEEQRALVRAWVRRHAEPPHIDATSGAANPPFWTSHLAGSARGLSLTLATLPAALALGLIGYAFGLAAPAPGIGATALVSTASVLALISAVIASRRPRDARLHAAGRSDVSRMTTAPHRRPARLRGPPHASM